MYLFRLKFPNGAPNLFGSVFIKVEVPNNSRELEKITRPTSAINQLMVVAATPAGEEERVSTKFTVSIIMKFTIC